MSLNPDALDMADDDHPAGNASVRYVHKDVVEGLLFWIAQGNYSAMPIKAIEDMQDAVSRAKRSIS